MRLVGPLCEAGRFARCAHPSCELIVRDWCRAIVSRLMPVTLAHWWLPGTAPCGAVAGERFTGEPGAVSCPVSTSMGETTRTLGQIAFEAHRDYLDGTRPWSDVREPERQVWEATAAAVAEDVREWTAVQQEALDAYARQNGQVIAENTRLRDRIAELEAPTETARGDG